jgi:hypothetical protein
MQATADSTGTWRQLLPATPASTTPHSIAFAGSGGQRARLDNVLFGDVYLCSGQSEPVPFKYAVLSSSVSSYVITVVRPTPPPPSLAAPASSDQST